MVGVSVRTILVNVFTQIVVCGFLDLVLCRVARTAHNQAKRYPGIVLYLFDSSEETSWMILFSSGMGIMIEMWKITKAVDIKVVPSAGTAIPYKVEITDKHVLSEDEEKTKVYDKLAYKVRRSPSLTFSLFLSILHYVAPLVFASLTR